ncbi:MAG: hypothetical protein Q8L95_09540, partial [Burkholderiales bacterium]|nr:hypothetical protein [Burkholderiales bacterium]
NGSSHIKTVLIVLDRQGPAWAANALTAPNGGEAWLQETSHAITWDEGAVSDANPQAGNLVSLEYSTDGGASFPNSIASGEANDGSYAWTVPTVDSTTVRVRVTAVDKAGNRGSDASNANFTIAPIAPTLGGISVSDNDGADPAPAEAGYTNRQSVAVTLSAANNPTQMILAEDASFSVNSTGWIAFNANATYSLSGGDGAKTVYAKVKNSAGESAAQNSAIILDTTVPGMQATTLTAPNGGEFWLAGSTQDVIWNSGHIADANLTATPLKLAYSSDGGASYGTWTDWEANDGSYSWLLPMTPSYQAVIKVVAYDRAGNQSEDASNTSMAISPPSNYIVTNTNDSGAGSLRQAMTDLVAAGGNNTIWFEIPAGSLTNGVA